MKAKMIGDVWKKGNRAFYWTEGYTTQLCLQSREYNNSYLSAGEKNTIAWVYYSKRDARELYKFLSKIFKRS